MSDDEAAREGLGKRKRNTAKLDAAMKEIGGKVKTAAKKVVAAVTKPVKKKAKGSEGVSIPTAASAATSTTSLRTTSSTPAAPPTNSSSDDEGTPAPVPAKSRTKRTVTVEDVEDEDDPVVEDPVAQLGE